MLPEMIIIMDKHGITVLPLAILLLIVALGIAWRSKHSFSYLLCFCIFSIYLFFVIDITLFPIHTSGDFADVMREQDLFQYNVNLIPFYFGPFGSLQSAASTMILNIILTIPFGFGINFIARIRPKYFLWLPFAVGIGIEGIQLIISLLLRYPYRVIDINDVLMNALGVAIGYIVFRVFAWFYVRLSDRFKITHRGITAYVYELASFTAR